MDEDFEDTPFFWERCAYLEGRTKDIKAEMKGFMASAGLYFKAAAGFAEASRAFARKSAELAKAMPELEHVANGMACLNSLVENMCEMNDQILMDPMEKMLADIKRSKELKASMAEAADGFYLALKNSLSLRPDADAEVQRKVDSQVLTAKLHFNQLRLKYLTSLSDLSSRRRHQAILAFFQNVLDRQLEAVKGGALELEGCCGKVREEVQNRDLAHTEPAQTDDKQLWNLVNSHYQEQDALELRGGVKDGGGARCCHQGGRAQLGKSSTK